MLTLHHRAVLNIFVSQKCRYMQWCSASSSNSNISCSKYDWYGKGCSAILKAVIFSFREVNIPLKN